MSQFESFADRAQPEDNELFDIANPVMDDQPRRSQIGRIFSYLLLGGLLSFLGVLLMPCSVGGGTPQSAQAQWEARQAEIAQAMQAAELGDEPSTTDSTR